MKIKNFKIESFESPRKSLIFDDFQIIKHLHEKERVQL